MVTATEAPPEATLRQLIVQWVEEQLGMGGDQADAFQVTAERIVREGHSDAFVEEFAKTAVREVWQSRVRLQRKAALNGSRRVDIEELKSTDALMDVPYYVDGKPIRLGDLNRTTCQKAKVPFVKEARGVIRNVNFLDRISQNLKADQTVGSAFTEDQLRSLWEASRVMD